MIFGLPHRGVAWMPGNCCWCKGPDYRTVYTAAHMNLPGACSHSLYPLCTQTHYSYSPCNFDRAAAPSLSFAPTSQHLHTCLLILVHHINIQTILKFVSKVQKDEILEKQNLGNISLNQEIASTFYRCKSLLYFDSCHRRSSISSSFVKDIVLLHQNEEIFMKLSKQRNITKKNTCKMWHRLGVRFRSLSLTDWSGLMANWNISPLWLW